MATRCPGGVGDQGDLPGTSMDGPDHEHCPGDMGRDVEMLGLHRITFSIHPAELVAHHVTITST